jgi:hypothetical protein
MIRNIKLRRELGHGGAIPRGWRMAWYEPRRRVGVFYPFPLHALLRGTREFFYRIRLAISAPTLERAEFVTMQRMHHDRQRMADEYSRGYMTGWRECFRACVDAIEDEMEKAGDAWEVGALLADTKQPRQNN